MNLFNAPVSPGSEDGTVERTTCANIAVSDWIWPRTLELSPTMKSYGLIGLQWASSSRTAAKLPTKYATVLADPRPDRARL